MSGPSLRLATLPRYDEDQTQSGGPKAAAQFHRKL